MLARITLVRLVGTLFLTLAGVTPGFAADFPSRPIRLVVAYPPGGGGDILARALSKFFSEKYNQSMIVVNKPGATGTIAATYVSRSPPDGYTLFINTGGAVAAMFTMKDLAYNPLTDFAPIVIFGKSPIILLVYQDSNYKSVQELITDAKSRPGKINYGTPGVGTPAHIAAEQVQAAAHIQLNQVPFKGASEEATSLLSKQVPMIFHTIPGAIGFIKAGQMRPLMVASDARSSILPDVPTGIDVGLKNVESYTWYGLSAPANTPRAVVDQINKEANEFIHSPDGKKLMDDLGIEAERGGTPEVYGAFIKAQADLLGPLIKTAHITTD
jgi:tripartite-type tricarboxylate transporter receptor subunit TctC